MGRDLIYPASWTCYSPQWFSCSSAAGLRWLCRRHADSRPRCSTNTQGGALAIIHHHHQHHHHTQKRSSSRLTLPVRVNWTQTRLLSNSTFSDSRPHSKFSEARVFQARTLAPPASGLHSDLQRHAREKTFLYSKLTDARVTQNAPTPGQLRCTKSGVRRCDGLRLASAALSDKMN